jgi:RNA polymerase sigma-70 factor (ECF subfamily)
MHDEAEDRLRAVLAAGRDDAVAALYDRYGRALFRFAWTMFCSRHDAEDAVQEVFLGIARSRQKLAGIDNLRAYLFSSLRHAIARLASRRKLEPLPADEAPRTAEVGVDAELSAALERGLAALPAEQREVLSLKIDGELTFAEIASVLEISPNTAASRYRYALEKLRSVIETETHGTGTATTRPA